MSNLSDLLPAGAGAKVITATASGSLAAGKTVILQSDGTVKAVADVPHSENIGSAVTYGESGQTEYPAVVFDPDTNQVVIAYRDNGNSNYGTARVGTISGDSISFGSAVVFESAQTNFIDASYDTGEDKVLIAYTDAGDGNKGKAIVGTVSGTGISFGSALAVEDNSGPATYMRVAYSPYHGKHLYVYSDGANNSRGAARLITVSGTSATRSNPETLFETNTVGPDPIDVVFDSTNNVFVVAYNDNNLRGRAKVGTVSGSSISFGSDTAFEVDDAHDIRMAFDSSNGKVVLAFQDEDNDRRGRVVIGTVSGTSISFGTKVQFEGGITDVWSCTYDSSANKVVIQYRDQNDSDYGKYVVGTVSGTSISFEAPVTITNYHNNFGGADFDSNAGRIVFALSDSDNSRGKAYVLQLSGTSTNSGDFVGITNQAIANSASGQVVVPGGVVTNSSLVPATYTGSLGSEVAFESARADHSLGIYDSSNNKVVVVYADDGDSANGKAVVGTISGTSVSFGTPVTFNGATTTNISGAFDSNSNKVVISYVDSDGNRLKSIVGTVSGTSISFGSEEIVSGFVTTAAQTTTTFDSNSNKIVLFYRDDSNSEYGTAAVGTVSGTSISYGTPVVFESAQSVMMPAGSCFDSTNNKVVVAYKDVDNSSYGTAIVGTVSGTSISFGTAATFHDAATENIVCAFDSVNSKVVVAYRDQAAPKELASNVGTVSGTSISFGSKATVESHSIGASYTGMAFSPDDGAVVVTYSDNDNSTYGEYAIGVVSGTSIVYSTPAEFASAASEDTNVVYDTNVNKFLITYKDVGNSNYGTGAVLTLSGSSALTIGSTYYVQNDGSLSTTSSSVTAGKAIGTSTLLLTG